MKRRRWTVAAAILMSSGFARARAETSQWRVGPTPGWVVPAPAESAKRAPVDESVVECPLDDTQVRVSPGNLEQYHHIKLRPRSASQVDDISQVEIEFNPAHERLVIHEARVLRNGATVSTMAPADVRLAQRERDMEQRIYDGTLTAVVILRDVRVDDVIDYAYTIEGADPVLGGKFAERFYLADNSFLAAWRERIVLPATRTLTVRTHGMELQPRVTTAGEWREYVWERRDVPPYEPEDHVPSWDDPVPWVDVSEFASWAEITQLFERLFPPRQPPGPAIAAEVARIRARSANAPEQLLEATRFVQDEIRYTGLEIGLSGHQPFPPAVVLERRFGDCKDKSVLLVTLLRELGFSAQPALVNTVRRRALDGFLPSPYSFNHAIVQVTVDGRSHFIDATSSYERGPLAERQPPDFERALLVAPETTGLTQIPRPVLSQPTTAVRETYTVAADGGSADLEVETTLRGDDADRMRARLAARSKKEIARGYLNYYAEQDSTVSQVGQLETADDERRNVIVVRERYHFGAFWRDSKREFPVSALAGHLGDPSIKLRRMAYRLDFPLDVTHTTIVRLPSHPDIETTTTDLADEHLRFAFNVRTDGNDLVIRYDLRALADAVPPEKAQRFFSTLDEIKQRAWFVLHRDNLQRPGFWGWTERIGGVAGYVILGLVVLAIAVAFVRELFRGKRRRSFKKNGRFAQGEAAATAIEVDSEEEATAQVPRLKCECGARYRAPDPTQSQRVAYDGRSLLLLEARCSACERHRRVFFSVRPGPVASAS